MTRIAVSGSFFEVRIRGGLAEAVRVDSGTTTRGGSNQAEAGYAMAKASGCAVVGVLGDKSVATGVLSCAGVVPPPDFPIVAMQLDCIEYGNGAARPSDPVGTDISCASQD